MAHMCLGAGPVGCSFMYNSLFGKEYPRPIQAPLTDILGTTLNHHLQELDNSIMITASWLHSPQPVRV